MISLLSLIITKKRMRKNKNNHPDIIVISLRIKQYHVIALFLLSQPSNKPEETH